MLAALIGSAIPVNGDWKEPTKGVTIYVYDNGVHTSLILPRSLSDTDLGLLVADPPVPPQHETDSPTDTRPVFLEQLPDAHFPGSIKDYPYLMFGWGDARFYRETPTWGDVQPGTALAALIGSGKTLVHVDRLDSITSLPASDVKRVVLREEEFARLLGFLTPYFINGSTHAAEAGYNADDRFYLVTDGQDALRYSAFFTCNNWVGTALAQAGVKTGYWTPLPFGVMWWLPDGEKRD